MMKEININIEGYNVNGICVGCLNYKRKMFYHKDIIECYKLLGNIDVPDGLDIQVCWECYAAVRTAMRFRKLILKSYDFLMKYSQKNTFLENPNEFTCVAETQLVVSKVEHNDFSHADNDKDSKTADGAKGSDVKEEELKFEVPIKEEVIEDAALDDSPAAFDIGDVSSDEDIQLSKLKDKESKRRRKKKRDKSHKKPPDDTKKSRKLKNLPEDIVHIRTMTEEEMRQVRAADVASEEFQAFKYKCVDCIIKFNSRQLMEEHMTKKHQPKGDDSKLCDVCNAYFLTKDNVSGHRTQHLAAYECSHCGLRTTMKQRMSKHIEEHTDITPQHVCDVCGQQFGSKHKLNYHRSVSHQQKPQCDCCGKVFANKMTLKYHLKILPHNPDKVKEKVYIKCKGCDKVFDNKKSYRAHVVIHNGITYPCPTCGKQFQWKRNLARHARNHRERAAGARHECRACGKSFASRDCYNNHMRMSKRHVAEDAYQHECNYCGKKFATKWCLTDHIDWEHLKRIKYQCHICFKAFKTAKIMIAHVNNIHEGKKRDLVEGEHLCDICGKSYRTVKRLKGHVWAMHTKRSTAKSFRCKLCPATFTWQTSIYKHMKMMHDDNKKLKPPRPAAPVKKEEHYPDLELANRMFFQQNIPTNLNIVNLQPLGQAPNIL